MCMSVHVPTGPLLICMCCMFAAHTHTCDRCWAHVHVCAMSVHMAMSLPCPPCTGMCLMCPPPNCVCDVSHRHMHVGDMAPGPMHACDSRPSPEYCCDVSLYMCMSVHVPAGRLHMCIYVMFAAQTHTCDMCRALVHVCAMSVHKAMSLPCDPSMHGRACMCVMCPTHMFAVTRNSAHLYVCAGATCMCMFVMSAGCKHVWDMCWAHVNVTAMSHA